MKILLNGKEKILKESTTIAALITEIGFSAEKSVALVNEEIVEKSKWNEFELKEGDSIELVSFVGGG